MVLTAQLRLICTRLSSERTTPGSRCRWLTVSAPVADLAKRFKDFIKAALLTEDPPPLLPYNCMSVQKRQLLAFRHHLTN